MLKQTSTGQLFKGSDTVKSADFGRIDSEINYDASPTNNENN